MLDVSKMDSEEKELWKILTSKFEGKELIRVLELIAIDAKKYQKEQLLNSRLHSVSDLNNGWDYKLKALLEGLECNDIEKLMILGKVGDYRRLGERMKIAIDKLADGR